MENNRIHLSKEEFERYEVHYPCNSVIVEVEYNKDIVTKTGIKVNFNEDTLYEEGTDSHIADMAHVVGIIVKQPERLYFNMRDIKSMSWECDLETQVGDMVWSHALNTKNAPEIMVDDRLYQTWPYEDLFVAKRIVKKDLIQTSYLSKEILYQSIIPLNGNVILKTVYKDRLSELDNLPPEIDPTRGIVKWNGSDNKRYQARGVADMQGLKEGDLVVIDKNTYPIYLERNKYNATFDDGNLYYAIQKRHILGVI